MIKKFVTSVSLLTILYSTVYAMDEGKSDDQPNGSVPVVVLDQTGKPETDQKREDVQTQLSDIEKTILHQWNKVPPVRHSSLRSCDAMPSKIKFSFYIKGHTYDAYMTQYNDRALGEMSDCADFDLFYRGKCIGIFYSLPKSNVFEMIHNNKLDQNLHLLEKSEKESKQEEIFFSDGGKGEGGGVCMGTPF